MKLRRTFGYEQVHEETKQTELRAYKIQRGFYSVPPEVWETLSPSDMKYVKEFNGKLRKKREQEDPTEEKRRMGPSIRNRRTVQDYSASDDPTESSAKKRRTVEFVDGMTREWDSRKQTKKAGRSQPELYTDF